MTDQLVFSSATVIAQKIKSREISCLDIAKQFLSQIKVFQPKINAISDLRTEASILNEAREKDKLLEQGIVLGPLHGVPLTVKDTYNVKGLITSNGNSQLKNNRAKNDAELVKRLKAAGAIIMGKTNLALFALDWQSTNKWFGQSNNPYDLDRVVGGSSGGSAAALAAGFTPLELGTDSGGSIRVPAHFCGVCGLRTTESALSIQGNMETPGVIKTGRYLTSNGPLARNVDDLLLMLEVLWDDKERFVENPPVSLKQFSLKENHPLKLAYSNTLGNVQLDHEYKVVYDQFIHKLGHQAFSLTNDRPKYDETELTLLWGKIAGFDLAAALKKIPFKKWITYFFIHQKYKDKKWAKGMAQGAALNAHAYTKSLLEKDKIGNEFYSFFERYDAWITPVSAAPAFRHQKPGKPFDHNGTKLPYASAFIPFNFPTTLPGHPIVVIPIGMTKSGLPVGIQIHGKRWHDFELLQVAKRLEGLTDGFKIPKMFQ